LHHRRRGRRSGIGRNDVGGRGGVDHMVSTLAHSLHVINRIITWGAREQGSLKCPWGEAPRQ
jgi:hypothetical protein